MKLHHDKITVGQVIAALGHWQEFWELPWILRQEGGDVDKWAEHFCEGINCSRMARKHWMYAKHRVFAICDRFPWPRDIIEAARQIEADADTAEKDDQRRRQGRDRREPRQENIEKLREITQQTLREWD